MTKKVKNHKADIQNPNKGTKGTNKTYAKAQGNRGKLMNPNWFEKHTEHKPKNQSNKKRTILNKIRLKKLKTLTNFVKL